MTALCCVPTVMSGSPASVQMDEVRRRSQSVLSVSGSAQDVKADVQTMASLPLTPSEKYRHLGVEAMLKENADKDTRQEVNSAFPNPENKNSNLCNFKTDRCILTSNGFF